MALEHAILVSLAERSASGYDLARHFDASIGHFWRASHQQIYKVLARMEKDEWVSSEVVAQQGRPDKRVYVITAPGREELLRFTSTPTAPEPLRSEFAVKLRGLPFGDAAAILQDVRARRARHEEQLALYVESAARFYPDPDAVGDAEIGAWLVLRGGMLTEQVGITWCDEILQRLDPVDAADR